MKTLQEQVIEQLQQENSIDKDEAYKMVNNMCNSYLLTYMSNILNEMFKEHDAQIAILNQQINILRNRQY